jgi:hypothetical protein
MNGAHPRTRVRREVSPAVALLEAVVSLHGLHPLWIFVGSSHVAISTLRLR